MQCCTLYSVQISIYKRHTTLLSTLYVLNSAVPQYKFWGTGGRVPPSVPRDLRPWFSVQEWCRESRRSIRKCDEVHARVAAVDGRRRRRLDGGGHLPPRPRATRPPPRPPARHRRPSAAARRAPGRRDRSASGRRSSATNCS